MSTARESLELLDWKRRVFSLYDSVRDSDEHEEAWEHWRRTRDELFAAHPQSPLTEEAHERFDGLEYFDYDPEARVTAEVAEAEAKRYEIATSGSDGNGSYAFTRFATAGFELAGEERSLELYWLEGYGGGVFLPVADATSGKATYGAGRYVLDTVKGADLGEEDGRLVLDFNFAYNPSCSYDPSWVCPLATPANRLPLPIEAGERHTA